MDPIVCKCGKDCTENYYQTGAHGPATCPECFARKTARVERETRRQADRHFAKVEANWRSALGLD
jgi:hypothetical protein